MLNSLRARAISLLESHPYGYALGVKLVTATDLFLPHEVDYHGFTQLAKGRRRGLILDLGANQGHSARAFVKLVPGWEVFSVEPNPLHEPRLRRFAERCDRYRYRLAAIDSVSGRSCTLFVPIYRNIPLHSAAAVTLENARGAIEDSFPRQASDVRYREVTVSTVTVDDLGVSPQIIKLDVQGKELDALKGATRTLAAASPDLLIELVTGEDELLAYLTALDYRPFAYHHAGRVFSALVDQRSHQSRNVFFSRRDLTKPAAGDAR